MYISTRGEKNRFTSAAAIKTGIAADGGLFVPEQIPVFNQEDIASLTNLNYQERALKVLSQFLTDYTEEELTACVKAAYSVEKFSSPSIAPLHSVDETHHLLELWHGPTSAFKDMALQLLPQLMSRALVKTGETSEVVILVATSGDTGKAALEGFKDVKQIRIIVFFPNDGVSAIQRMQMVSQEGENVAVVAVRGNFDDAQTGVKNIFNDTKFNTDLAASGFQLSSANSINWGRLVPQIVYYFSAYSDMVSAGKIQQGQSVNFVVPTGNFGNILAGYYAKLMGLPIHRLICASNSNNVLTDFLQTGIYNRKRSFHKTLSPSMDILISSNLERLLYEITAGDSAQVAAWMSELSTQGSYTVGDQYSAKIQEIFWADWADDDLTLATIQEVYQKYHYVLDTHTAVAWHVGEKYRSQTQDITPQIIVSTASPFKFSDSVLTALQGPNAVLAKDEFVMLQELAQLSSLQLPAALAALETQPSLHNTICDTAQMPTVVKKNLGIC